MGNGLGSLPGMKGIGKLTDPPRKLRRIGKEVDLPHTPYMDEETEAERLEKKAKQGVLASLPERIVWKWLEDHHYVFDWQAPFYGGKTMRGGFVVDFVVYGLAPIPVAIRVMGDYWHGPTQPGEPGRDDEDAARLRAQGYLVCDLWEEDIYREVDNLGQLIQREMNV